MSFGDIDYDMYAISPCEILDTRLDGVSSYKKVDILGPFQCLERYKDIKHL